MRILGALATIFAKSYFKVAGEDVAKKIGATDSASLVSVIVEKVEEEEDEGGR